MFFSRRRRGEPDRWLWLKTSILCLAAGVWLAGVITEREAVTGAALGLMVVGLVLVLLTRVRDE